MTGPGGVIDGDWRDFSAALALTLARLPAEGFLILTNSVREGVVQFAMDKDELFCELACEAYVDDERHRVSPAGKEWLIGNGWLPPPADGSNDWHRMLAWPARFDEYKVVADQAVVGLRDILGVGAPTDLETRAWVDGSDQGPDLSALGLRARRNYRAT